jgi:SAM-dependent methyltransferase
MSDGVTNLFVHRSAAARYAAARPYFHPLVIERFAEFTKVPWVRRALDIGCGTGQSARALAAIADQVEAIDISPEMISAAESHERVHFRVSPAEQTPFEDSKFDLATVGLAFHWFDQAAFFEEMRRVLKPGAWLVVYTSGITGEMAENPDFRAEAWDAYLQRFPTPARRAMGASAAQVEPFGLMLAGTENFAHQERMTAEQLTAYLLTQTNVIAAVEASTTPLDEAADWIHGVVKPFFRDQPGTLKFVGTIWYLRRSEEV